MRRFLCAAVVAVLACGCRDRPDRTLVAGQPALREPPQAARGGGVGDAAAGAAGTGKESSALEQKVRERAVARRALGIGGHVSRGSANDFVARAASGAIEASPSQVSPGSISDASRALVEILAAMDEGRTAPARTETFAGSRSDAAARRQLGAAVRDALAGSAAAMAAPPAEPSHQPQEVRP
jgi:hypothetical protein